MYSIDSIKNQTNVLEPYLNAVNLNNKRLTSDLYGKLNDYLVNTRCSQLNCLDLIKFFDATCLFLKSSAAAQSIDSLILIQLFSQNISELLNSHLESILKQFLFHISLNYEQISTTAKDSILFMMQVYKPNNVWIKLLTGFDNESLEVKYFLLDLLQETVDRYGQDALDSLRNKLNMCLESMKNGDHSSRIKMKISDLQCYFNDLECSDDLHDEENNDVLNDSNSYSGRNDESDENNVCNAMCSNTVAKRTFRYSFYEANVIARNIDCSHCSKSTDYYTFFKIKIKELLGCKWSITNLRLRPIEKKKIFYFRCVKYRAEAIKCPAKCIVELDLDTQLAAIKFNSKSHNHDNLETNRSNQKKLSFYNIVAENINCGNLETNTDYHFFFNQKLSEFLGGKWAKIGKSYTSADKKQIFYHVCLKYGSKKIKCQCRCIIELDLSSHTAKILHNSKQHNHPI